MHVDSSYLGRLHPKTAIYGRIFDVTRFVSDKSISVHAEDYLMLLGLSVTSLFLFMLKII